jgi:hypothetical protein
VVPSKTKGNFGKEVRRTSPNIVTMKMVRMGFNIALLSLVLATEAEAQTPTEKYELSERCGVRAADFFARDWKQSPSYKANYENHYNVRLNKCFYIEIINMYERGKDPLRSMTLYDLHENRQIGLYVKSGDLIVSCSAQQRYCRSEQEWRALIKPFMED